VFCEPASAAGVAGLLKYRDELPDGPIVCTLTGHGLKDPETAVKDSDLPGPVAPRLDAVLEVLDW
jgi:threonine synthase